MIALGGPKLKPVLTCPAERPCRVSMIALGGPKLKPHGVDLLLRGQDVSMIALGGPKLKLGCRRPRALEVRFQ